MTKRFRHFIFVAASVLSALGDSSWVSAAESVRLETFRTHSRIRFRVDEGVTPEFKSTPGGFEIYFKGIGFADLGAPLGEEEVWANQFRSLRDPRIGELKFAEVAGGLRVSGKWIYPQGADAPINPHMDAFEYRDKTRSDFVMDFWVKEGPTVAQVKVREAANRKIASVRKSDDAKRKRNERREARAMAKVHAEDALRFCRAPITDESDVFLRFLPVHERIDFNKWMPFSSPDAKFSYYEPQGKEKDAQYVRLALSLYREGKHALVNRTLDFMDQEFPGTDYRQEMRFLRANALLKLGIKPDAERHLSELLFEARQAPVGMHAAMYLAGQKFAQGDYLAALEKFLWLIQNHPESRMAWLFHMGAAESARELKQTERAAQEYQWVAEHAPEAVDRAQGALRAGDLYMDRFQYEQALAAYYQGVRMFKDEADKFPAVHLNRAEALYWLGQYDRAKEAFEDFLKKFPTFPPGWRATYRLGEIDARKQALGGRDWYFQTVNRYPFSPGATLARMRLMPCGDHAGFSADSAERFFKNDAEKIDGVGQIAMERYSDFRALAKVRTLAALGKLEKAVTAALEELKLLPGQDTRRNLNMVLGVIFRKTILDYLDKGLKLEALTFYQQRSQYIPRGGDVDPDYLLKLSQAASDLSLGKLAQELNREFDQSKAVEAPSRKIASQGDDAALEDPEVRLALSEQHFTRAKALWIGSGMKEEQAIREELAQVDAESRFSYQKELILGLMDEKKQQPLSALKHAIRAQLLLPSDGEADRAPVAAWVTALEARAGDMKLALEGYRAIRKRGVQKAAESVARNLGVPAVPGPAELMLAEAEILEKMGRWGELASTYERALEDKIGGAQASYGYARALLKTGSKPDRKKAIEALEKLVADKSATEFWRRLAEETLANERKLNEAKEG